MKIQYEKGDRVFLSEDFGNNSYEIVDVKKQGVTVEDKPTGERFYKRFSQIEATSGTLAQASTIQEETK
jgi:hypothetical protein